MLFPRQRRLLGAAFLAVTVGALLGGGGRLLAHIDPDPVEAPAGSTQAVGFTVEHGCDGSATTQLDMRLPDGVTDAVAEPLDGWNSSFVDNVMTFSGGPLPDETAMTFRIRMTLPNTPGQTIFFPFVQRCEIGEIAWIDLPAGDVEPEQPAPAMVLLDAVEALPAVPPTAIPPKPAAPPSTDAPSTVAAPVVAAPVTTTPTPETKPTAVTTPDTTSTQVAITTSGATGAASESGTIVFVLVMAVVIGVGAFVVWRVRRPT